MFPVAKMTSSTESASYHGGDSDEKGDVKYIENVVGINPSAWDIQQRFETLKDLSETEIAALNTHVRKIIDWRMMPCVTVMFLMKSVYAIVSGLRSK